MRYWRLKILRKPTLFASEKTTSDEMQQKYFSYISTTQILTLFDCQLESNIWLKICKKLGLKITVGLSLW